MKLNQTQIEQLKKLISYKGYPEIDVQYEILDHVACEVEKHMEENPNLSLDDAFRKVHASFGIFGFSPLEESYKKMIVKRIWSYYWEAGKELIFSYRIIYPLALVLFAYQTSIFFKDPFSWILVLLSFVALGSGFIVIRYWGPHKKLKNYACFAGSKSVFQYLNQSFLICIYAYQFVYRKTEETETLFTSFFKGVIILALVGFVISIFILPKVLNRSIRETDKLKSIYESQNLNS